jgi:dipeptidyl aminopeptidase/acylaminoacyl peptidase
MTTGSFIHHLLTLPSIKRAALSPDGRWVAFMWYRIHENIDVFLVPANGSSAPIPLTHTKEATSLISWAADSSAVILSEDHDRDERARLFRVDIDRPEVMHPLTEDSPAYFMRGGSLHPDGVTCFYGMNYDVDSGKVIEPTWIYRHNLESGERTPIARPTRATYVLLELNRAGTHLLYPRSEYHPAGWQFHLVDIAGGKDEEILNFGDQYKVMACWLPDGENILVHSESVDGNPQNHKSLGIYHWPSQSMDWLIDDVDRNIEDAWVSPDGLIVVDEIVDASHFPTFIDPETREEIPFPRLPGNMHPIGRAADGAWVGIYYSATSPSALYRFTLDARETSDLTPLTKIWDHTQLKPDQLSPAEDFRWISVDGQEIQGWLYRASPNLLRAIVYVHGGPTSHAENSLNAQIQYFVSQGFNVLDVNYRGSTGFNFRFQEAIKEDGWGGREQDDITSGAQALIDADLAAPFRVGVTGTSYGGYSSWCQITHAPPETIAAAAPICGMTDLVVDYNTTRPDLRPYSEAMIGGTPDEIPEKYQQRSPINYVQEIKGKLLIVQGARDPNVTPENVREVEARLQEYQIPYLTLIFEDEGHGIIKTSNQAKLYPGLVKFFEGAFGV